MIKKFSRWVNFPWDAKAKVDRKVDGRLFAREVMVKSIMRRIWKLYNISLREPLYKVPMLEDSLEGED
ncbi:CIC_collapsed_G0027270.mRNA.1.CDS.1 [Saccharomyces cerevisiae]|nr:CIC_collapsed_G0027270.mRNA.1.CDS.1 [Saccharomyces cerevisiae]